MKTSKQKYAWRKRMKILRRLLRAFSGRRRAAGSAPRYYWKKCYELDGGVHWALCDTDTDKRHPGYVSCFHMVLWDDVTVDLDKQHTPKLVVDALNEYMQRHHGQNDQADPQKRSEA